MAQWFWCYKPPLREELIHEQTVLGLTQFPGPSSPAPLTTRSPGLPPISTYHQRACRNLGLQPPFVGEPGKYQKAPNLG